MAWYKCNKCGYEYHSGFSSPGFCNCPKCWDKFSQIWVIIKPVISLAVPALIVLAIIKCASPAGYNNIVSHTAALLDSTPLYTYSKDAYLESVVRGRRMDRYFVITEAVPYYSSIIPREKLDSTDPLGELPEEAVVELGSVIRRGGDSWIPVTFYIQEKPHQAFALFPRDWEELVTAYNWDERVSNIKEEYQTVVKENFELMEVEKKGEKEYKEKYNDYYKVKDIGDKKTFFYTPKTNKSQIDNIHSYYLNRENINMVVLQTDAAWERPALEIKKTEDNQ